MRKKTEPAPLSLPVGQTSLITVNHTQEEREPQPTSNQPALSHSVTESSGPKPARKLTKRKKKVRTEKSVAHSSNKTLWSRFKSKLLLFFTRASRRPFRDRLKKLRTREGRKKPNYQPTPTEEIQAYITWGELWIKKVAHVVPMMATVLLQKTRGGKTTDAALLSDLISHASNAVVTVLSASNEPSTTHMRMGVFEGDTLLLPQIIKRSHDYLDYQSWDQDMETNVYGVRVIASPHDASSQMYDIAASDFTNLLQTIFRSTNLMLLDGGNNLGPNSFEWAAAEMSDVLIFPCRADDLETLVALGYTIDTLLNHPDFGDKGKVSSGIVVVNGVRPGHSAEEYAFYAQNIVDSKGNYRGERSFDGPVLGVPYDDHLAEENVAVNLESIKLLTRKAGIDVAIKALQTTAARKGIDLTAYNHLLPTRITTQGENNQ